MITPDEAFRVASNIRADGEDECCFTPRDFRKVMPAFTEEVVNNAILSRYCEMANRAVQKARWGSLWEEGVRLYVAHFVTLYIQTAPRAGATLDEIINAGRVQGSVTSKSVGGVSVSMDNGAAQSDMVGWAGWKLTAFGQQFVTLARMVGKGMMYIR